MTGTEKFVFFFLLPGMAAGLLLILLVVNPGRDRTSHAEARSLRHTLLHVAEDEQSFRGKYGSYTSSFADLLPLDGSLNINQLESEDHIDVQTGVNNDSAVLSTSFTLENGTTEASYQVAISPNGKEDLTCAGGEVWGCYNGSWTSSS